MQIQEEHRQSLAHKIGLSVLRQFSDAALPGKEFKLHLVAPVCILPAQAGEPQL
jgi:hypothetical protein